jgi:hypothetical protein
MRGDHRSRVVVAYLLQHFSFGHAVEHLVVKHEQLGLGAGGNGCELAG